jgi:threonine dehydrogenase-like Zn-dependent dehydrogenase
VYHVPGRRVWEDVDDPTVRDPEDAVVRVHAVTICGTDLHILKGDVPTAEAPRGLGHEAVGTVKAMGEGVRGVRPGDRVLVSCISACGRCRFCREARYGQCLGGGWILGGRHPGDVRDVHGAGAARRSRRQRRGARQAGHPAPRNPVDPRHHDHHRPRRHLSTPTLLRMVAGSRLAVERLVTHRFGLQEMQDAYDVFSRPESTGALNVALFRG